MSDLERVNVAHGDYGGGEGHRVCLEIEMPPTSSFARAFVYLEPNEARLLAERLIGRAQQAEDARPPTYWRSKPEPSYMTPSYRSSVEGAGRKAW